ncbi:MAG: hypothetical protein R3F24_04855 [Gammaproteobacteria bacterium]
MSEEFWATIGAALGVALGVSIGFLVPFLVLRWRRASPEAASGPSTDVVAPKLPRVTRPKSFHGVSLRPGPNACSVVHTLVDQRYLSNDAPPLPLPGCNRERCECTYGHYRDRRDTEERRFGWGTFGGFTPAVAGGNRRQKKSDRRSA